MQQCFGCFPQVWDEVMQQVPGRLHIITAFSQAAEVGCLPPAACYELQSDGSWHVFATLSNGTSASSALLAAQLQQREQRLSILTKQICLYLELSALLHCRQLSSTGGVS